MIMALENLNWEKVMRVRDNRTWVMVANGSECKIFAAQLNQLQLLKGFYSENARSHSINLGTERPGRVHESSSSVRHAIEPKIGPQAKEKNNFSHLIADYLNDSVNIKKFKHLILVASPEFLGKVRKYLSKPAAAIVTKEINKDLVDAKEGEILKYIL